MVDLFDIQAAYYMVAATGVLVAAVFYILNLQVQQKKYEDHPRDTLNRADREHIYARAILSST